MPMTSPLGIRIRRAREQRGWTRQRLADETGIGYTTLSHIEKAERQLDVPAVRPVTSEDNLQLLSDVLDISFDELRILAGYKIVSSADEQEARARLGAQIEAHPELHKPLSHLLTNGSQATLDQAATLLEWLNAQQRS